MVFCADATRLETQGCALMLGDLTMFHPRIDLAASALQDCVAVR